MSRILFDRDRTRFFAWPDDQDLPPGDTPLQLLGGGTVQVDLAALAPHEIDRDQATALVSERVDHQWDQLRDALDQVLARGRADQARPAPRATLPALDELLGMRSGQVITEPELLQARIKQALCRVGQASREAGAQLRAQAPAAEAPSPEELAEQLRGALDSDALRASVASLGQALGKLGAELQAAGQRLQEESAAAGEE